MLMYEHKTTGRKIIPNVLSILDEYEIARALSFRERHLNILLSAAPPHAIADPDLRMRSKSIAPGIPAIDLDKIDLMYKGPSPVAAKNTEQHNRHKVPWRIFLSPE